MYKVISTKIKKSSAALIERVCAKKGMTIYSLFQMYSDVTIRYMSDRHNLTPEMERMMLNFENMEGWSKAFNFADYTTTPVIEKALYFIGDKDHKGCRGVIVNRPFFNAWTQELNVQDIFEQTLNHLFPERYKRLRQMSVSMGCTNILDMIDALLVEYSHDADTQAIREEFEDCNRSDYGTKASDHLYKQKKHFTPDTAKVNKIRFKPEDVPELPELVKPFDQEY